MAIGIDDGEGVGLGAVNLYYYNFNYSLINNQAHPLIILEKLLNIFRTFYLIRRLQ